MTEWKTYKIGDLCEISSSKRIFAKEYKDSGIPFYRGKEIIEKQKGNKISTELYISQERYDEIKAKHGVPQKGDMLLTSVGTLGIPYIVQDEVFYFKDGNLTWFYNFEGIDSHYLYYWFLSPIGKMNIDSKAIGSTQKALTIETLSKFEISLPSLEEQRKIAGILGAIDDKIENNRRINANLELQAQALYKQWFVDNRKNDWGEKQLGEIALHITDGVHNTVIDSPNGEYYLLSCKNIKSGQLLIGSNERRIDHETFTKLRKRTRLSQGDILVTSVGTVGEMYLVNESLTNYEFQRSVAIIKPNQDIISSYFLYAALLYQQNEIKHLAHGAVQQCIFISDLKEYSLIVPNKDDISTFDAVVAPMFNKIGELQKENETLATLRDTLLPKLMNGEIKIVRR